MSIFNSTYQPALSAMISDSLPPDRRGMGFNIVMLIAGASTTPSPAVAGLLYRFFGLIDGMRIAYGIVITLFLAAVFLRLFLLKETIVSAAKSSVREIIQSYPTALKESFGVWKKVPKSMLYLFPSSSIAIFGFSATNLFTVIFATTVLQIDKFAWAMLIAVLPLTTILLALPVGKLVDKYRRKISLLTAIFLFGLSMWIFIDGYTLPQVAASLILIGAGQVMINASIGTLQTDLTPKELRGKINGFMNFSNCIIMAIASMLAGYLYEHVAPQAPFMLAAIMALPSFAAELLLVKEPKTREE